MFFQHFLQVATPVGGFLDDLSPIYYLHEQWHLTEYNMAFICTDSTWSRFFRSAELERMVDQDLSRLYPEHGSYFQTPGCQGMLRRILLLWCLRHPECGYRQGKLLSHVTLGDIYRLSHFS